MGDLRGDVAAFLEPMICRTPEGFGGALPGAHCAACCMQTGFNVGSQEELDLARLLSRVLQHLDHCPDIVAGVGDAPQPPNTPPGVGGTSSPRVDVRGCGLPVTGPGHGARPEPPRPPRRRPGTALQE